jgi:hypothetical protein
MHADPNNLDLFEGELGLLFVSMAKPMHKGPWPEKDVMHA